jgi:hypothetical protein
MQVLFGLIHLKIKLTVLKLKVRWPLQIRMQHLHENFKREKTVQSMLPKDIQKNL